MIGTRIVRFHTFAVVTVECECCILYSILKVTPNSHTYITLYKMLKVCMYVGSIRMCAYIQTKIIQHRWSTGTYVVSILK